MILHTVIDINEILYYRSSGSDEMNSGMNKSEYRQFGKVYAKGQNSPQGFRIESIFSTNPKDFLNPKYKEGEYL